jgi:hypothetical protein
MIGLCIVGASTSPRRQPFRVAAEGVRAMLLVTFHGGSGSSSINNVYVYDTNGTQLTKAALGAPKHGKLSELRAMALANGLLYVANGDKSESTILAYEVPSSGTSFTYAATVIGPTLSKKGHFESAIAHPFGLAFSGATCFISNQDTNVVGRITVTNQGLTGNLVQGPPNYLAQLFPTGSFLAGTYVASQVGVLDDVETQTPWWIMLTADWQQASTAARSRTRCAT